MKVDSKFNNLFILLNKFHLKHFEIAQLLLFANDPGDRGSIRGRVISKTQKMVLDAALLNTQHYIKGKMEQSRERSITLPYPSV